MPHPLEYRTLFLASGIVGGALTMLFAIQRGKSYPGFVRMLVGLDVLAAGLIIGGVEGYVSDALLVLQIITVSCFALINSGIRLFCGVPRHDGWPMLYVLAGACLQTYLYFTHSLHVRILVTSLLLIPISVDTATALLKSPSRRRFSYRFTAAVAILTCAASAVRIVAILSLRRSDSPYFESSSWNSLFFLLVLLLLLAVAFAIIALVHERLVADLLAASEERSRAEKELAQAERLAAVGRLAGGVAHFFNNQMYIIQLACSLLRKSSIRSAPSIETTETIDQIDQASKRSADITSRLLQYAQSKALRSSLFNPVKWIDEMTPKLRRAVRDNVELRVFYSSTIPDVKLDADLLLETILVLVRNAQEAMPAGGKLTISQRDVEVDPLRANELGLKPGSFVVLSVSDTGAGMDQETQRHLFEPFFTTKELKSAGGLGLASAYGFIQQSGGSITVRTTPTQGSTFELYLPTAQSIRHPIAA